MYGQKPQPLQYCMAQVYALHQPAQYLPPSTSAVTEQLAQLDIVAV